LNLYILNTQVQEYINNLLDEDYKKIVFKKSPFTTVSSQEIFQQVFGRTIAKSKLPTWFASKNIYYPPKLNLEQTSSEQTALFKASLFKGSCMADLTGGFGIDSYFFSKSFKHCDYFEQQEELCKVATHNFKALGANNITVACTDGIKALKGQYDLIYLDPARRDVKKSKVFRLEDCSPNILDSLDTLFTFANRIMIKTSPMLDLSLGIEQLVRVTSIYAVAVNNELKELLWVLESKAAQQQIMVNAINFTASDMQKNSFVWGTTHQVAYGMPKSYLYIGNAALMKLGHFGYLSQHYKVEKLHKDSHFFTSDKKIAFPGRCFEIQEVLPYNKTTMKSFEKSTFLVISRTFPLNVKDLRKRWKIKDGGNKYLIFTTLQNGDKAVLSCKIF
jgi:hypothetical protein